MGKFTDSPYFLLKNFFDLYLTSADPTVWTQQKFTDWFYNTNGFNWTNSDGFEWDYLTQEPYSFNNSYLIGQETTIVTQGYWFNLWVKNIDEETGVASLTKWQFAALDPAVDGNFFKFKRGELLSTNQPDATIEYGSEIYFRKDSRFHSWLRTQTGYENFTNTNRRWLYFGKIYPLDASADPPTYSILFDGMKDYVMRALPRHNRTTNLYELTELYFDRVYHETYNLEKNIWTLMDPKEINFDFIHYIAQMYKMNIDENLSETSTREWVANLVNLLKRKGTYSSLYIPWKVLFGHTENDLNVYERWHDWPISGTSLPHFIDIIYTSSYGVSATGCAGEGWYTNFFGTPSSFIFTQNTGSSEWFINHGMNNQNIFVACYDNDGERIWPLEIQAISTNTLKVTLSEEEVGVAYLSSAPDYIHTQGADALQWNISHNLGSYTLSQYDNTTFSKQVPSGVVILNTDNIDTYWEEGESGYALIQEADYVYSQVSGGTNWTINHNLDELALIVQFYDHNFSQVQPDTYTLVDSNTCSASFSESVSGYALFKIIPTVAESVLPTYGTGSGEMILSPHYRVEIDLTCEAFSDDYIIDQTLMDNLLYNWERIKPISRYAWYNILISPITDFTGGYTPLYEGDVHEAYLNTRFCGENLTARLDESTLHIQTTNSKIWEVYHEMNSRNFIVQVYDEDGERIWPDVLQSISNEVVRLEFNTAKRGHAYLIKPTDTLSTSGSTWINNHGYGQEVVVQYSDETYSKIVPSGIELNPFDVTTTWSNSVTGDINIIESDYKHTQAAASTSWTINHNFGRVGLVVQFYDSSYEMIRPDSVTLVNSNTCIANFNEVESGYALLRWVDTIFDETDTISKISSGGYWKLGSGTSTDWDPISNNDLENTSLSGTRLTVTEDLDYYYINIEARKEITLDVTEMGIFNREDNIVFYTSCSTIHKPSNVWFNGHFRVEKIT